MATLAFEKFDRYLVGLYKISVVTDHRPLVPLISNKDMRDTTPMPEDVNASDAL